MIRCLTCGARNRAEARFCRSCGGVAGTSRTDVPLEERERAQEPAPDDRSFVPGLTLFFLLFFTNVVVLVAARASIGDAPTRITVATVLDAVVVSIFAIRDRRCLPPLVPRRLGSEGLFAILGLVLAFPVVRLFFAALEPLVSSRGPVIPLFTAAGWPRWSAFAVISIGAAIVEETAFRGVMMERFGRLLREGEVMILQAALFAIAHASVAMLLTHFALGVLFGLLRRSTGSLIPGMIAHAAWNAAVLAIDR